MSRWFALWVVAFVAVVAAGCGADRPASGLSVHGTSATTAAELDGRELVAIAASGHHLVVGSNVTLGFEGGQFRASGGCNGTDGSFSVKRGRLRVPREQEWTMMGCRSSLQRQDAWLGNLLAASPLVRIGDGGRTVVLVTDQETLTLARRPAPLKASFEGRTWNLVAVVEPSGRHRRLRASGTPATLRIAGGYAVFDAGCRSNGMLAKVVPGGAEFGGVMLPARHCSGNHAVLEQVIRNTLRGATKVTDRGRSMTVMRGTRGLDFAAR